jgi:pimeloyl-ACP methyl ester carboxylesterase
VPDGGRGEDAVTVATTTTRVELPPYTLWVTRAGAGRPVVLLHGLSASSRWWSKNVDALAAEHLVAAVDLTGFGHSTGFFGLPATIPSFGEVTALLARWLETFDEPVHLIGHSMGGQIAIRLTAERPDLVRSLMLVNSAGIPFRFDPLAHLRPLPKPPFGGPRIAQVLLPDFLRAGPTSVAVASARVLHGDMRAWMREIRVPTLLVWGANDPLVPLRYGEAMAREIPDARLIVIERAAHVAMWDAPDEFNQIALDWLRSPPSAIRHPPSGVFTWGLAGFTGGIAHRQAGRRRDLVLVHGLGMSSAYFGRFAHALFDRGWNPIAPDLPGFGESANARAAGPDEHARDLAAWADALQIRDAVWVGHSIGCNTVAALARMRPDLVRRAVHIGPVWTRGGVLRVFAMITLDALREPLALYRFVIPAYWRAGLWRWWRTWCHYARDVAADVPADAEFLAGERDPIVDRRCVSARPVRGAHACHFSDAGAVAGEVGDR